MESYFPNEMNLDDSALFESLPIYLKETIMQSGLDFKDEDELRAFVAKYEYNVID